MKVSHALLCLALSANTAVIAALCRPASCSVGLKGTGLVGCIVAWPLDHKRHPEGWHVCNGDSLDEKEYPELASLLGTTYGTAETGKFKLPDFRGYFLRGLGGVDSDLRRQLGGRQDWSTAFPTDAKEFRVSNGIGNGGTGNQQMLGEPKSLKDDVGWAQETRPVNYAVHWVIRIK